MVILADVATIPVIIVWLLVILGRSLMIHLMWAPTWLVSVKESSLIIGAMFSTIMFWATFSLMGSLFSLEKGLLLSLLIATSTYVVVWWCMRPTESH